MAEIRVKDALSHSVGASNKNLFKQIKVLKAIVRTPRMYRELKKSIDRRFTLLTR